MRYLLDTHTLIWAITEPAKLSERVSQIIKDRNQQIIASVVNFWEISLKSASGRIDLKGVIAEDFPTLCERMYIDILPLSAEHASTFHNLTVFAAHKDPFDRMLIWQAKCLAIPILSKDGKFKLYESEGISVVW